MVKVKEKAHVANDGTVNLESWLQHLATKKHLADLRLIRQACLLSQLAGADQPTETGESCLQQGLAMADILADLDLDQVTLAAAIVYESVQYADLSLEDVRDHLGEQVAKLVDGVARMNTMGLLRRSTEIQNRNRTQADNIRKMLIAMVDNIQVVLIKLAERIRVLRNAAHLSEKHKHELAQETMDIYAPLANRLGIGQIKWELEDLAFRYLEPETYKNIAKALNARRVDRDRFVHDIVQQLQVELEKIGLKHFHVYGRSKHIYSIYRKMQRKNVDVDKIYDATAVRVLVEKVEDCYKILSIVHDLWQQIPEEFDDYINNPKENGYRSLHTAVIGPEDKNFEVQIRTQEMHDQAELGVAAHWIYKEGATQPQAGHERKIAWLRQVLDWQKEVSQAQTNNADMQSIDADALEDRIYVFTPAGEIIDLIKGATPLDFAYHIHSEIGHRCRGAKVDGNIVPLTYQLKTGEQISIITTKQSKPSRDWLNPHLGYLYTAKAKAKVMQWFKQQDYEKHKHEGQETLERELRKHNIPLHHVNYDKVAHHFHQKNSSDLLAGIGRGDLRLNMVISAIESMVPTNADSASHSEAEPVIRALTQKPPRHKRQNDFVMPGIENVLARPAQCCKPIPGDSIVGYIKQGQGVAVHRKDCTNILRLDQDKQSRLIEVSWGNSGSTPHYAVDISVLAHDRPGLIRDITTLICADKINIAGATTKMNATEQKAYMTYTLQIPSQEMLHDLIHRIQQMPDVIEIKRLK